MVAVTWLAPGLLLAGRYQLVSRIAAGGMGEVWRATDSRLDRDVAVKVLRSELSDDPEFRRRFLHEAHVTASLNAPGIAVTYDYGDTAPSEDGAGPEVAYLVMELVDGEPLSTVLARRPRMPVDWVLDVLEQAGEALDVAHQRGLVHRDVKPANVLITGDGRVKLTDFGIARTVGAATVTRTGMVIGTAQYMSPEQAGGQKAGTASDVYALGVVGYEALAGHRPFDGESAVALALQHLHGPPPPLPEDVPPGARALIETAMAKDPLLRYSTGGEIAYAAAAVRGGRALPPRPGITRGTAQVRPAAGLVASGPTAAIVAGAPRPGGAVGVAHPGDVHGAARPGGADAGGVRVHGGERAEAQVPPAPAASSTEPVGGAGASSGQSDQRRRAPKAVLLGMLALIALLLAAFALQGAGDDPTGADAPAEIPSTAVPAPPSGGAPTDAPASPGPDGAGVPGAPAVPGGAGGSGGGADGAPGGGPVTGPPSSRNGTGGAGAPADTGTGPAGSGGAGSGGAGSGADGGGDAGTDGGTDGGGTGATGGGTPEDGTAPAPAPGPTVERDVDEDDDAGDGDDDRDDSADGS